MISRRIVGLRNDKIAGSDFARRPRRGESQGGDEYRIAGSDFAREPHRGESQGWDE